jgi:uncharacterized protein YcfJ
MLRTRTFPAILLLATTVAAAAPVHAQSVVIQTENVRTEYARVLRAEPVYQTLRATSMVKDCGRSTQVAQGGEPRRGLAKVVGAVKDALTPGSDENEKASPGEDCRMVPSDREFRRPIAYDVDYVHHGVKYRSRLPYDPGNRLRVRVSIAPIVPAAGDR